MRWKEAIAGVALGLLAVTACGQPAADRQAGSGADGASESASEQFKKRPAAHEERNGPVPEDRINGRGLPQGHPTEAKAQGSRLTITAQEGGCGEASAQLTGQEADTVSVRLVETEPADKMMCTMDMRYPPVTVQLDQPLGDRTLVLEHTTRKE